MLYTAQAHFSLTGGITQFININALTYVTPGTYCKSHMYFSSLHHLCIAFSAEAVASFTDDETSMGRLQLAVGIIPEG